MTGRRMRAGDLRHEFVIQSSSTGQTPDSIGAVVDTWGTFASVRGDIKWFQGSGMYASDEIFAQVNARIRTRYVSGVTPKMRILFGSRVFRIESVVNEMELGRYLSFTVKEIV